jgi:hypothetical protein
VHCEPKPLGQQILQHEIYLRARLALWKFCRDFEPLAIEPLGSDHLILVHSIRGGDQVPERRGRLRDTSRARRAAEVNGVPHPYDDRFDRRDFKLKRRIVRLNDYLRAQAQGAKK